MKFDIDHEAKVCVNELYHGGIIGGSIFHRSRPWNDEAAETIAKYMRSASDVARDGEFVEKARIFATAAHAAVKQTRKYTGEPYITHPAAVAGIVESVPHNVEALAAAWLHDTVEDTGVTLGDIEKEFGHYVGTLVYWLTDVSKPKDGNRRIRKALDREHIAKAPAEAQTIKLADLIDNTKSIVERDPAFAKVYLAEKAFLVAVMDKGDPVLLKMAREQISAGC